MKKVVNKIDNKVVKIDDCDENKIYAIHYKDYTYILTLISGNSYKFIGFQADMNLHLSYDHLNFKDTLDIAINGHGFEVYEFDTEKEFLEQAYKWVTGQSIEPAKTQEVAVDNSKVAVDKETLLKRMQVDEYCPSAFSLKNKDGCSGSNNCFDCRRLALGLEVQE